MYKYRVWLARKMCAGCREVAGLRGAGKAVWVWAWGSLICVEKGVKIWHSGAVEVLADGPGSVVEIGSGGVGRRWN